MKRTLIMFSLVWLMFNHFSLSAGDRKTDIANKMEKVEKLEGKEKYDDAEEVLVDLLDKYSDYGKAWDKLAEIREKQYQLAKRTSNIFSNITITRKDKNGNDVAVSPQDDTLTQKLATLFSEINPSKKVYNKMMLGCRLGCMYSNNAWLCSIRLRGAYVDALTDTNINASAKKYFSSAEIEFRGRNYNKAAEYYQKAIDADPSVYKARLYLGDVYYMTKRYDDAITAFQQAVASHPDQQEPRKYLSDAYFNAGIYDKAYASALDAVILYPDLSMIYKLIDAASANKQPFALFRIPRGVLPNHASNDSLVPKEELKYHKTKSGRCWQYYMEAKKNIASNCDAKGNISGAGDITKQHYLEVYSWEYMLSKSKDKELDFARKMQSKGYLDCYVMVSCFHQDFYDQYKNFADLNKQRIKDYFAVLMKEYEER